MRGSIVVTTSSTALATALSTALIACGGGGTSPGDACSATQPCDSGQVCDLTNPGGPVCLDGSGDVDGDGIPNDKDFCEHMPGGAFDEDGDGIGDECDACPIAKPPATPETDGDGVDSPCDPNPTMPGDKIVLFEGFNNGLPSKWAAGPDWKVMGGEAIVTPANPATIEQLSAPVLQSLPHMSILTAYRIDSVAAGASNADAAVISINMLPAGTTSVACGGSRTGTGDQVQIAIGMSPTATQPLMNLFDPASLYQVAEQIEGGTVNCALIDSKENGAVQANSGGNGMTAAGLFARGATARFAYLLVVSR